jgi:HK97 family phage portal protein
VTKNAGGQFGEIDTNQFAIYRPSAGHIDPAKALANNRGYVYAAVNAIAREVMNIDWRLFEVTGKDHEEKSEHAALNLLDSVNDTMTGPELKYLLSAHLDLTGNAYWYLEGVKGDLDKPTAIYPMDPSKVRPVLDTRTWPYQLVGYKMKLENKEMAFKPYEVIHFRLPDPSNMHEGLSPVQAGAEFIDNDNYAMDFNRKFFTNGARPSGFLESEMVSETQIEALKIGFANMHQGIDNMNRIAVLPKGVKWTAAGSNPKDMDFKNLSENMRDRILSLFGVSKTILGTAESDTNRATAETADYVFSKRVIKPRMQLICSFLNERFIPRFGDDLYISFLDPVPEDRAARTTEMQAAVGSQPVLTINEARDEFMGLGPTEGGDELMKPTAMGPAEAPVQDESDPTKKPPEGNDDDDEGEEKSGKKFTNIKAANGQRVAFRPVRTKLQSRAKARSDISKALSQKIKTILEDAVNHPTKKFESTKELDEAAWKEFSERTTKAETEIKETVRRINAEQKERVLANIPNATKSVEPEKLFNLDEWISITTNALTPTLETLFTEEAKTALATVGKPDMNPFTEIAREALHDSIAKLSTSYQTTVRNNLEKVINDGLAEGQPLTDLSKAVGEVYGAADDYGAERLAKTEAFRTSNMALKTAWQQSGVVKTVRWYTSELANVCPFCQQMNGKIVSVDSNFLDAGQTVSVGDGDDAKTYTADYGDVSAPPLHPNCLCFLRPEEVSI